MEVEEHDKKCKPGVWYFGIASKKSNSAGVELTRQWVCSPLYVDAVTADEHNGNFGRVLRFKNSRNAWRTWAMPMELLAGSGENLRAELLAQGVTISQDAKHHLLLKYVGETKPTKHIRCTTRVGWSDASFVLPSGVIGPSGINVIFQSGERGLPEYAQRGNLDGWREEVSARAIGNPVLMLALSAAFAGPLLQKVGGESGGIHFVSDSSAGKSTALRAAASVWGGPEHVRSWNATANGMEGVAAMFNDNLLPLDEISSVRPATLTGLCTLSQTGPAASERAAVVRPVVSCAGNVSSCPAASG